MKTAIDKTPQLSAYRLGIISHAIGAKSLTPKRLWGFRNRYAVGRGTDQHKVVVEMARDGLMASWQNDGEIEIYSVTRKGLEAAGFSKAVIARAMED